MHSLSLRHSLTAVLITCILVACGGGGGDQDPAKAMQGTWKIDFDQTEEKAVANAEGNEEESKGVQFALGMMRGLMGNATFTFTEDTMTIDPGTPDAESQSIGYKITKTEGDTVHIEIANPESGEVKTGTIIVAENHIVMTQEGENMGLVLVEK